MLRRARRAIQARPKEIMPKPKPAPTAVAVWTRSSGMGPSTRVARPKTRQPTPAVASTPWPPYFASSTIIRTAADREKIQAEEA